MNRSKLDDSRKEVVLEMTATLSKDVVDTLHKNGVDCHVILSSINGIRVVPDGVTYQLTGSFECIRTAKDKLTAQVLSKGTNESEASSERPMSASKELPKRIRKLKQKNDTAVTSTSAVTASESEKSNGSKINDTNDDETVKRPNSMLTYLSDNCRISGSSIQVSKAGSEVRNHTQQNAEELYMHSNSLEAEKRSQVVSEMTVTLSEDVVKTLQEKGVSCEDFLANIDGVNVVAEGLTYQVTNSFEQIKATDKQLTAKYKQALDKSTNESAVAPAAHEQQMHPNSEAPVKKVRNSKAKKQQLNSVTEVPASSISAITYDTTTIESKKPNGKTKTTNDDGIVDGQKHVQGGETSKMTSLADNSTTEKHNEEKLEMQHGIQLAADSGSKSTKTPSKKKDKQNASDERYVHVFPFRSETNQLSRSANKQQSLEVKVFEFKNEPTESIVYGVDCKMSHNKHSMKIQFDESKRYAEECRKILNEHHSKLPAGEVVHVSLTEKNQNTKLKHVIHVVLPIDFKEASAEEAIFKCLIYADHKLGVKSMTIPDLCSGLIGIESYIQAALRALQRFTQTVHKPPKIRLQSVNFVAKDKDLIQRMIQVFCDLVQDLPGDTNEV